MKTMKVYQLLATFAVAGTICSQAQTTWQTRMIQQQIGGATGIPELVGNKGAKPSLPIGENGSRFELWGWKFEGALLVSEELLDTTEVGTYGPRAEIIITTLDPYEPFPRTRVDQPFSVTYAVTGLIDDGPGVPLASRKVLTSHHADLYTAGSFDGSSIEATNRISHFNLRENGNQEFDFLVTNLTAPDLARRAGRERFEIQALADGDTPQRIIAEAAVEVYPLPEGYIAGIDTEKVHTKLPEFRANVWRAYPSSSTWVEIYSGEYAAGKRGDLLGSTLETPSAAHPEPFSQISFTEFPQFLQPTEEGKVTLVLRTSSPFPGESIEEGGMIIDYLTFSVGGTLEIRAMITTSEVAP